MARSTKVTTSVKPTHELVLRFTLPDGRITTIGYVGLFEGNDVHELMVEKLQNDPEELDRFLKALTGEVVEAGSRANNAKKITSLF